MFSRRLRRLSSKSIRHLIAPDSELVAGNWRELRTLEKRLIILAFIAIALASSFNGAEAVASTPASTPIAIVTNADVAHQVETYFSDIPVMIEIARCESHMRQYGSDGRVIRGEIDSDDVGVMQINTRYHKEIAKSMGLDIEKLYDNMVYARKLYEKKGTGPWVSSKKCWGPKVEVAVK